MGSRPVHTLLLEGINTVQDPKPLTILSEVSLSTEGLVECVSYFSGISGNVFGTASVSSKVGPRLGWAAE
jgi:hypothetical protein